VLETLNIQPTPYWFFVALSPMTLIFFQRFCQTILYFFLVFFDDAENCSPSLPTSLNLFPRILQLSDFAGHFYIICSQRMFIVFAKNVEKFSAFSPNPLKKLAVLANNAENVCRCRQMS